MTCVHAAITTEPLNEGVLRAVVAGPEHGAIVTFAGVVRAHDPDAASEVVALEYSAHPDAERMLHELAGSAAPGPDVRVAVRHRVGRLRVGEDAVLVVVAAAHRDAAFTACREVIERVKHELPVWKRQIEADGTARWKGLD